MTKPDQVWIVDDDRSIRWVLEKALQKAGIQTRSFSAGSGAYRHSYARNGWASITRAPASSVS